MAWFDEDLRPQLVGEPTSYFYGTQHEVAALAISAGDRIGAYAFYSLDPAENAAGFLYNMRGDFPMEHWYALLESSFAAGVPAADAVRALAGTASPDGVWSVGTEFRVVPNKDVLFEELNPDRAAAGRAARGGEVVGPDRDAVDEVLRGEARPTREIEAVIENLDAALEVRPTVDPLVVVMARTRASLPDGLAAGTVVAEPTYLRTVISTPEVSFPDAEVVVTLRIEPGTPALFLEPESGSGPGTLLLARGLTWQVTGVVEELTPVAVYGRARAV